MCMTDDAERVTELTRVIRKAKKDHRCDECRRVIVRGESYLYETFLSDGQIEKHKTCAHCRVVRGWLAGECGGWVYGALDEDIREHVHSGGYSFGVKLLAIGIDRSWKRKDGRLWPIPRMPKTTHEILVARAGATQ